MSTANDTGTSHPNPTGVVQCSSRVSQLALRRAIASLGCKSNQNEADSSREISPDSDRISQCPSGLYDFRSAWITFACEMNAITSSLVALPTESASGV